MPQQKPLSSILIKPAGPDCNLGCDYCFYLKKAELFKEQPVHRMSDRIQRHMIKQVMWQGGQQVSFGWQGGEPTLMGREFYERAVEYQVRFGRDGQVVGNGLQTNGVLIDKSWAQFLRDAHFLVGLSLDGPQHIHDKYRKFPGGKGSWERVSRARDVMLHEGVEVNALVVVNNYSVDYVEEIYHYHKAHNINFMQFIPIVEPHPTDPARSAPYSVDAERLGDFFIKLYDLWKSDFRAGQPTTSVRFFDSVFHTYVGMQPPECTLLKECGIYVVVEHNGDVYSCDFFVDPQWRLGNVLEDKLIDLLNSPRQNEFGAIKAQLPPECVDCPWLMHCRGGCPKDRQGDPRDRGSNHFCEAYKRFFEHADQDLRRLAAQWRQQQYEQRLNEHPAPQPEPVSPPAAAQYTAGRNEPCPCGSGKKFKNCCGKV
ncbi:MAG: anaerobic sulfatase maturase [candidate division KSB1 bacterium]|nr:anaerobic sulfatase maturase [candidate division KSB1 bacterium]